MNSRLHNHQLLHKHVMDTNDIHKSSCIRTYVTS